MKSGMTFLAAFLLLVQTVSAERRDTVSLNEIVVTAVKQAVAPGSEPLAETIVKAEEIKRLGILSPKGLSDIAPNVFIPDYGSRITSSIYMRGLGSRMEQPVMGLIIDNVPVLNKDAYDFDLPDMESVRIIRGPQSALFGRNTMCGVMDIRTLSPLAFNGIRGSVSYGSDNDIKVSGGYYASIGTSSGISASLMFGHTDGHWLNNYNRKKTGRETQWSGRIKFESRPSDVFRIQNVFSTSHFNQSGYPYQSLGSGEIAYNDTCFYRRFLLSDGLTASLNIDNVSVTGVASIQYIDDNMTLDQDFLPESFFTLTQKKKETGATFDVVVTPRYRKEVYNWLAGAFVFGRNQIMHAPVTFLERGIADLIVEHRNSANTSYPISWDDSTFPLLSDFRTPLFGTAFYHRSELHLGKFSINAALRFDYEIARLKYTSRCSSSYTIFHKKDDVYEKLRTVDIEIDDSGRLTHKFIEILPDLSVSYSLPEELGSVYADVSKGYKAGGFNNQMFSEVLQQRVMGIMGIGASFDVDKIVSYKPEQSWNYEIGAHLKFKKLHLDTDVAIFYIDCRNQQLTVFPPGTTTGRMMTNAGRTHSRGFEITVGYSPIDNLNFNVAYGFTDARFKKFNNGLESFAGKHIPYAPGNTLFAQVVYTKPLRKKWVDAISISANVNCAGPIYWNEQNSLKQNFYATPGLSVTLEGKHYSIELWGRNITSTKYYTFYFISMQNEFVQRALPARFGVTLRFNI